MFTERFKIVFALTTMTLVWGSTWAAIRIGLQGIPPFAGVALRFAVAAVLLFALARVFGIGMGKSRREVALWWINGVLTFVVTYGLVYWAEQRISSGLAAVLFATFPLWVALLAQPVLPAERFTLRSATGILIGFAGVAVIFSEDLSSIGEPGAGFAAAVMMLGPFAAAVANVAVKRWGQGIHPISLTAMPMAISAVVMAGVSLVVERGEPMTFDAVSIGSVLYLAVFGSAFTFYCYFWLLERLPATSVALTNYVSPVVAVLLGAALLDEALTVRVGVGALLVVAGVAITVSRRPRTP
ncbi:MAG: EamA family transporter [Acidobacteriota bacterium]|jgi:drug/metabolite transporter (DMT)-like permease